MLVENTLFGTNDKVNNAMQLMRDYEPLTQGEGYYLAFSGGKDSITIKKLAEMAGVKFDAHYNLTTIDPPELVWFIKQNHPDVQIDRPEIPFLLRLAENYPPMRQSRWCCKEYKERGGAGRYVITGVRRAESNNRKNRRTVEHCSNKGKIYINPLIEWDDQDVWGFIRSNKIPYCKLYDEGWKRIGCLFCPFASARERRMQAERYPVFKQNFIKAFEKSYQYLKNNGKAESVRRWKSGEEMFWWWLNNRKKENTDQCAIFE